MLAGVTACKVLGNSGIVYILGLHGNKQVNEGDTSIFMDVQDALVLSTFHQNLLACFNLNHYHCPCLSSLVGKELHLLYIWLYT